MASAKAPASRLMVVLPLWCSRTLIPRWKLGLNVRRERKLSTWLLRHEQGALRRNARSRDTAQALRPHRLVLEQVGVPGRGTTATTTNATSVRTLSLPSLHAGYALRLSRSLTRAVLLSAPLDT